MSYRSFSQTHNWCESKRNASKDKQHNIIMADGKRSHTNKHGRVEVTSNERMPKQVVIVRMEEKGRKSHRGKMDLMRLKRIWRYRE